MPAGDADASWKGKAVEQLIAAHCVLLSSGQLNVSVPMVDDEGVDLVFSLRGKPQTLALQVKARFSTSKRVAGGSFRIQIRRATFRPRADLAILGVVFDAKEGRLDRAWLVPAIDFAQLTSKQSMHRTVLVMAAAIAGHTNQWVKYSCEPRELPQRIIELLKRAV